MKLFIGFVLYLTVLFVLAMSMSKANALSLTELSDGYTSPRYSFIVGGASYHFDRDYDYNEINNALGVCYYDACLSYFKNSYNEHSVMAFYDLRIVDQNDFHAALRVGVMGGYDGHEDFEVGGFIPMAGLTLGYDLIEVSSNTLRIETTITPVAFMFNTKVSF